VSGAIDSGKKVVDALKGVKSEETSFNYELAKAMGFGDEELKLEGFTEQLNQLYKDLGIKYILAVLGLADSFRKTFKATEDTTRNQYAT